MQVLNLHDHKETATDHNHGSAEEEEENREYIWKSCVMLLGTFGFYLFELFIHSIIHHLTKVCIFKIKFSLILSACTPMLQGDIVVLAQISK